MSSVIINLLASAQKMDVAFEPAFLNNSPSQICDQLLYLVKNSNLNFELQETPFSLNLQLKKSFAQHWKRTGYSTRNKPSTQDQFPQPGHNTENIGRQTQDPNLLSSHDPQQYQTHVVPQHQSQHVVPSPSSALCSPAPTQCIPMPASCTPAASPAPRYPLEEEEREKTPFIVDTEMPMDSARIQLGPIKVYVTICDKGKVPKPSWGGGGCSCVISVI